ncbi:hypothetical protein BC834DRAFT_878595 [Gloeopeniophorella convolvens]|nr:hypothetical protein BC834DRAFT_878595 [Gloeopeniophorella convolvens]
MRPASRPIGARRASLILRLYPVWLSYILFLRPNGKLQACLHCSDSASATTSVQPSQSIRGDISTLPQEVTVAYSIPGDCAPRGAGGSCVAQKHDAARARSAWHILFTILISPSTIRVAATLLTITPFYRL